VTTLCFHKQIVHTLILCRIVKIHVRDDSPTALCQYPLPHLRINVFLLVSGIFVEFLPTVHWNALWSITATVTSLRFRSTVVRPVGSLGYLLITLLILWGKNWSVSDSPIADPHRTIPSVMFPECFVPLDDFLAIFLATEGSTRRIARDGRPSRPARPARWIQTERACGVINWTTSSISGISVPCNNVGEGYRALE
jgi:hypothetical protein